MPTEIFFVYQGVTFHTFQNQAFFSVRTEKRAEKWIGVQKSKSVRTRANI